MDTQNNSTGRGPVVATVMTKELSAMARIRELSREISHLLNDLPHEQSVTIEPSATAVYPVLMMDLDPNILPDHLAMMNRGLAILERGAKMMNPDVVALGMLWGVDDGAFHGVAVHYPHKAGA